MVNTFDSVRDAVALALQQQKTTSNELGSLLQAARTGNCFLSERFLGWFLHEQVNALANITTLLTVIDRARGNELEVESYVARELNTPADADPTAPQAAGQHV